MTLDEIAAILAAADFPADIFGGDVPGRLKELRRDCHPDRFPAGPQRDRAERLFKSLGAAADEAAGPVPRLPKSPKGREYELGRLLAAGDVADVRAARAGGVPYVVKVSRVGPAGAAALDNEQAALKACLAAAGTTVFARMVPTFVESFPVRVAGRPRRINVFTRDPGLYTLEEVHARHPDLATEEDGCHLIWIFKRILMAIQLAEAAGRVHGAVLPPHVLLRLVGPDGNHEHGAVLAGWGQSVPAGTPLAAAVDRYRAWYPPEAAARRPAVPGTDIYMAARCVVYLAGGDPASGAIPAAVATPLRAFLRACLLDSPAARRGAGVLHDELDGLARRIYGAPRFVPLPMP